MKKKTGALLALSLSCLFAIGMAACAPEQPNPDPGTQLPTPPSAEQPAATLGSKVGDLGHDFTLENLLVTDETYTLYDHVGERNDGKVVVLNFWYTTCEPCRREMPHFARIAEEYADEVSVIAIHQVELIMEALPRPFLHNNGWDEYNITFLHDAYQTTGKTDSAYELYGKPGTYPLTVVLTPEGVITYTSTSSLSYEALKGAVDDALAK